MGGDVPISCTPHALLYTLHITHKPYSHCTALFPRALQVQQSTARWRFNKCVTGVDGGERTIRQR